MRRYWLLPFCFGLFFLLGACVITPLAPTPTPAPQATPQPTFTATGAVTTTAATTATTAITIAVTPTSAVTPTAGLTDTVTVTATPILTSTPAVTATGGVTTAESGTIAAILAARPEFSTLTTAIDVVQLGEELDGDTPYTLFAPTNDAFAALPAGTLDALLASPSTLASVIQNHLLIEEASSARLVRLGSVLTTLGQTLPVTLTAAGVVQLGDATIIEADIDATNGVIHGIDTVLLPVDLVITPTVSTTAGAASATAQVTATQTLSTGQQIITTIAATATIADIVQTTPELEMLSTALGAAGLLPALQLPGQLTLFAPTNAAFEAIPPQQLQTLLNTTGELAPLLQYHIVADEALAADLVRLGTALSTTSQPLTITVAADGVVQVNNAQMVQADIVATNGVIHLIDVVLSPPQE